LALKLSGQQVFSLEMPQGLEVHLEMQDSYLVRLVLTSLAELVYLVLSLLGMDHLEQQGLLILVN
jgi:hypothetical protein